jgi:glutaredoxin-related protein
MRQFLISRRKIMLKVYGTDICIDCRETKDYFEKENIPFEMVDITENTTNLKEFLRLRDKEPIFQEVRENGLIGIPFFVLDEKQTLDIDEAVSWLKN